MLIFSSQFSPVNVLKSPVILLVPIFTGTFKIKTGDKNTLPEVLLFYRRSIYR